DVLHGGGLSLGNSSATGTRAPSSIALGNLDGTKNDDAAVASLSGAPPNFYYMASLLNNDGLGTLSSASGSPFSNGGNDARTVVLGDFNNDGKTDLADSNEHSDTVGVKLGDGDGTFSPDPGSPYDVGADPWGLAVGMANAGSSKDLFVGNDDGD